MKRITMAIALLLVITIVSASFVFGADVQTVMEEADQIEETVEEAAEDTEEDIAADEAEHSEIIQAETEIFDAIDYTNGNLMSEKQFYAILKDVLALHDLEITPYPRDNGYFYFNYSNLDGVRLLTISRTEEELAADTEQAWEDYYAEVEEYAAKKEALQNGEEYVEPEEEIEEEPEKESNFDPDKDVENSQDYMISFVLSAGTSEMDQQVMFLVSAIAWCIMNPHYNNTDDAFEYLWRALYTTYGNSGGLAASTIDGIDTNYPFTIPGNATEAWLGTDDAGNYILAVTNYAVYDEIIDINATGPMNLPFSTITQG